MSIAPGYTRTALVEAMRPDILRSVIARVPVQRLAEPVESTRGVVFLASDKAACITGATLSINGGKYMS
jgi:acetoacetyl-CoA reductase